MAKPKEEAPAKEEKKKVRLDSQILAILKAREELTFAQISEYTDMKEKASNLSYHLKQLQEKGLIEKEVRRPLRRTFYKYTAPAPDLVEAEVFKIIESDFTKSFTFDEISVTIGRMPHSSDAPTSEEITHALESLMETGRIEESAVGMHTGPDGDIEHYQIPFWNLPEDVCKHCRNEFKSDDMIISQAFTDEGGMMIELPIHATCLPHMQPYPRDERRICCDYCGLNLSPKQLEYDLEERKHGDWGSDILPNKLIESGLAELFDTPYSKILPYIKNETFRIDQISQDYGGAAKQQWQANDLMYYVKGENGKKYHPYCARKLGIKE